MPPSSLWICCTRLLGITFPLALYGDIEAGEVHPQQQDDEHYGNQCEHCWPRAAGRDRNRDAV